MNRNEFQKWCTDLSKHLGGLFLPNYRTIFNKMTQKRDSEAQSKSIGEVCMECNCNLDEGSTQDIGGFLCNSCMKSQGII